MKSLRRHPASLVLILAVVFQSVCVADEIDFNRDVRRIISENCLACHGFDKNTRKADLRLDNREGATADLGDYAAIVPGKPAKSELMERITTTDPDLVMPPPDSGKKPLSPAEIKVLKQWIQQGAPWGKHWAFEKPEKRDIPAGESHPVDYFVRRKLQAAGLKLAKEAASHTLARRLSFDLTGLPPTPEQIKIITTNPSPEAWNKYIDQLLASPHFGERMAMWWLDGARYSDTDGFQSDSTRTNWPWRDWVVDAFNKNMPFDQFTIEQFAGDLLPDATPEQHLATCFHRNHMTNGEGGRDKEESRIDYVLDRVNTTGTLWLGLTLGCTQCHDHKFDPISQQDYYSLTAYFNSIDETGAAGGGAKPYLKYRSPYAQRSVEENSKLLKQSTATLAQIKKQAEDEFQIWLTQQIEKTRKGFQPWTVIHPARLATTEGYKLTREKDDIIQSFPASLPQDDYLITASPTGLDRITGLRLDVYPHASHTDGKLSHGPNGEFILTNIKLHVRKQGSTQIREISLATAVADIQGEGKDKRYGKITGTLDDDPRTGWTTRTKPGDVPHRAVFALETPLTLGVDEELSIILMHRSLDPRALIGRFRLSATNQPGTAVRSLDPMPLEQLAALKSPEASSIEPKLRERLFQQFLEDHDIWQQAKSRNNKIRNQLNAAKKAAGDVNVMILAQRKEPRISHILERGVWNKKGNEVSPGVLPAVLQQDPQKVPTRLELAHWIISRDNPLTARVITNQVWQLVFGAGLVRTPSDFGQQGEPPTHPELLDWLAADFMESGWDLKHLIRTIISSATYRQDSAINPALLEKDPENRLLARGARFRLPSWMIRDAALQASGLLNPTTAGPPVFPYQPPGIWNDQFMGRFTYQPTIGPGQYRRTLYAFWRRTSAPTFLFDSAMRRSCEVTTRRTNTPLHALTLLNDTTSLEAARTLAESALKAAPNNLEQRIATICLPVLGRTPQKKETTIFSREYNHALKYFRENHEQAVTFTTVGQLPAPTGDHIPELAASMLLANMVLNLDESITHE